MEEPSAVAEAGALDRGKDGEKASAVRKPSKLNKSVAKIACENFILVLDWNNKLQNYSTTDAFGSFAAEAMMIVMCFYRILLFENSTSYQVPCLYMCKRKITIGTQHKTSVPYSSTDARRFWLQPGLSENQFVTKLSIIDSSE